MSKYMHHNNDDDSDESNDSLNSNTGTETHHALMFDSPYKDNNDVVIPDIEPPNYIKNTNIELQNGHKNVPFNDDDNTPRKHNNYQHDYDRKDNEHFAQHTIDVKYWDTSDDEDDKLSTDSEIVAFTFRKRLEQLEVESKKLENLQFELKTIEDDNYIKQSDTICGVSIIEPQTISSSNKIEKRTISDYKVVFKLFTDNETKYIFNTVRDNEFSVEAYSFWKDTYQADSLSICYSIQLVDTTYTLFRKTLTNKDFIFLIVGDHTSNNIEQYRLVDILQ
eukprot:375609_1